VRPGQVSRVATLGKPPYRKLAESRGRGLDKLRKCLMSDYSRQFGIATGMPGLIRPEPGSGRHTRLSFPIRARYQNRRQFNGLGVMQPGDAG
jgi:hypothetical protein